MGQDAASLTSEPLVLFSWCHSWFHMLVQRARPLTALVWAVFEAAQVSGVVRWTAV